MWRAIYPGEMGRKNRRNDASNVSMVNLGRRYTIMGEKVTLCVRITLSGYWRLVDRKVSLKNFGGRIIDVNIKLIFKKNNKFFLA